MFTYNRRVYRFSEIPSRVDVAGELIAQWGPLPNHFNEPVLGAMLKAGEASIAIEEAEPGAYPDLHDSKLRRLWFEMHYLVFGGSTSPLC